MPIELINRADIVRNVPKRWAATYSGYSHSFQTDKIDKLLALPEGFTADQVDEIIGNGSWTSLNCEECGQSSEHLVMFGDEDYEGGSFMVCFECLQAASDLKP